MENFVIVIGAMRLNLAVKIIGLLAVLKGFIIIFGPADKHRGLTCLSADR